MENNDFKYIIQDFNNIYIGARWTYQEMTEHKDIPFKWKAVIAHYLSKDADLNMKFEDHLFAMTEHDFSYQTYLQLKAKVKVSVWETKKGLFGTKSGYVSKEYSIADIITNQQLHECREHIIVEELRLSKMSLMTFSV